LSSRRSRASKEFIDAKFSCIRYGNKQQSDDAINPRPSPKIGCKASLHVKRKQDGKWYVYNFVKEHNHELLPAQAHFFRSHRDFDPLKNDVRLRRRKLLASVSKQFGAYQNFNKCICRSWTEEQFKKKWSKLLQRFDLLDDEWLRCLYENRIYWVPLYMRGMSFAGLSTKSRSECLISFFDKYIHAESSLREFIEQYKLLLGDMYEEEAKAEFDAWHEAPDLKSPSPFEKQMSWVYTHEIFKKFQVEVLGAAACHLKKEKEDATGITYTVKDFENNQDFTVEWNESSSEICCLCYLFEHCGYLCRHAIVVLQMSGVFSIPSKYVLQRWTSIALSKHSISGKLDEVQSRVRRYNDLCRRALILAEEGSLSIESYNVAVSAIRDAFQQCSNANIFLEKDLRPNSCLVYSTNCNEDDPQVLSRLCVGEPDTRVSDTATMRNEFGKAITTGDINLSTIEKAPVDQYMAAVGSVHGFTQMETPNTRPAHLHNMFPVPFHTAMPSMYQGAAPGQFHHATWEG
ncbi:Protein FAR1-RELATED SEQUENCE 4, partial [Bienertia sinuspersici]